MPRFTRPNASLLLLVLLLLPDHAEAAAKQRNPYTVLGIKTESTAKEIKKAYRKMALKVRTNITRHYSAVRSALHSERARVRCAVDVYVSCNARCASIYAFTS